MRGIGKSKFMTEEVFRSEDKRTRDIHVRLNEVEYELLTIRARASLNTQVGWIRSVIHRGCAPKIKIHPWQADIYRELQMQRILLEKIATQNPAGCDDALKTQLRRTGELMFTIIKALVNDQP